MHSGSEIIPSIPIIVRLDSNLGTAIEPIRSVTRNVPSSSRTPRERHSKSPRKYNKRVEARCSPGFSFRLSEVVPSLSAQKQQTTKQMAKDRPVIRITDPTPIKPRITTSPNVPNRKQPVSKALLYKRLDLFHPTNVMIVMTLGKVNALYDLQTLRK
ncbi:hypothetical protein C0995_009993 [Termitomyces sp. Mi166|nr:hypothetical protein C0995_009993 [Termitomyces sp. Mi166\